MVTFRTIERDLGAKEINRLFEILDGSHTDVGLPEGGHTSGRYTMDELANVAAVNEFGSDKIPERSFLRSATDENREKVFSYSEMAVDKILARTTPVRLAIGEVGERFTNMVKKKIHEGPFEELAESTVAKKGHDMPLVETGQLQDSIQHKETVRGKASFSATTSGVEAE